MLTSNLSRDTSSVLAKVSHDFLLSLQLHGLYYFDQATTAYL
jgi:hypothetical protein